MAKYYEGEYTPAEYMAIQVSRQIRPDDGIVGPGFYNDIIYNGACLAMLTHAPNVLYLAGTGWTSLAERGLPRSTPMYIPFEYRFMAVTECTIKGHDVIQLSAPGPRKHCNVFFLGAMQVDKYGNQNISIIGDIKKPTFRGPGIIGLQTFSCFMKRYYIYTRVHNRQTFVDTVDFISCPGYKNKYGERKDWGLDRWNPGPSMIVTPIALMDFDEETKHMRLKSVHPGHTVEEVKKNTGLDLIIPEKVLTTEPPTEEEISLLRDEVDRLGALKREL